MIFNTIYYFKINETIKEKDNKMYKLGLKLAESIEVIDIFSTIDNNII